ncbi:MAG: Wzz/FepE/Etk N-terminal domain-containing protein, partial [Haliea sp.]
MAEPSDPVVQEDEIDLIELSCSLWAQKLLVLTVAFIFVVASAFYALRATPQYNASVVFEISSKQNKQSFSSDVTGLANFAGLGIGGGNEDKAVFDRVDGRDFILGVAEELSLEQDPYFNPYYGDQKNMSFPDLIKTRIKSILAPAPDAQALAKGESLAEDAIVEKFGTVVTATETKNGSIKITAVHVKPDRAAALANTSMNRLLTAVETERNEEQEKQLAYLSEKLADALTVMNEAQQRVQEFGLNNSLVSTNAFATRSNSMSRLRDELKTGQVMREATVALLNLTGSGNNLTQQDYIELRGNYPIVDDVDFRRFLGIPETLDQWTWPDKTRLVEFQNIISERIARAHREVAQLQLEAEKYAKAADKLASLERDARVAEAVYQVLIERTKSQDFTAGFDTDIAKIYQVAVPPTLPSAPRKSLIVALGGVLGLLVGAGLAISRGVQQGRLYSAKAIKETAQAALFLRAPLRFLRTRQAKKLIERAEKHNPKGLGALAIDLNEKAPKGILCV